MKRTFHWSRPGDAPDQVRKEMALLACWLSARRAMRVDPLVAIREE